MTLEEQVKILLEENKALKEIIKKLEKSIIEQDNRIIEQDKRISELEEELRKAKISKNSGNSSKPPSTDMFTPKRNQSLREKSGKPSGGQIGHIGTTLQMSASPDTIIELNPNYCNNCGCNLEHEDSNFVSKRQEIDIPPIQATVTEYRKNSKKCPNCGNNQGTEFPQRIRNHVQYGPNIETMVSYLWANQYIPYKRLKGCLHDFFNLNLSEGTIINIIKRTAIKALFIYNEIKNYILKSAQVGSDETSVKVNGAKHWIWTWQNEYLTYLTVSTSRGMETIDSEFPNGLSNSIINTDRWAAQLKTLSAGGQICTSHLLRDLNYIESVDNNDWANKFKELIYKGLKLKKQQSEYTKDNQLVVELGNQLDILLKEEIPKDKYKKSFSLQKSLLKVKDKLLTFLYHKDVPPDNNGSERAIRNVKVKQKVSGQFKSGQQDFCILRSVIDTAKKRDVDVWHTLSSIANLALAE